MDFDEEEIIKTKGKMYAVTTLSVMAIFIILVVMTILSIKVLFEDISKNIYYVVEVNNNNKNYILNLIEEDKKNIEYLREKNIYCESLYKIEYFRYFTGSKNIKLYCKNEENIEFGLYDNTNSELGNYLYDNGTIEKR